MKLILKNIYDNDTYKGQYKIVCIPDYNSMKEHMHTNLDEIYIPRKRGVL